VGGWEVRLFLGWSGCVVEVPEPPQERERMARSSTKYFMEGFISEMSGGRGAKGVGEIVKCVKNVKLRAGAGLEVVGDALVVEYTAFHTPFWLHEGPPSSGAQTWASTYRGGVARIDVFFSVWRNGVVELRGKVARKNFGKCRERNSDAQHFAEETAAQAAPTNCGRGKL